MSRSIETYIRGCQKSSLANTKDVLNIWAASSFENEHDEEPVIMRDEGSRVEACSHPKCMSSLTHMSWDIKIQAVLQ